VLLPSLQALPATQADDQAQQQHHKGYVHIPVAQDLWQAYLVHTDCWQLAAVLIAATGLTSNS
jgi:hypothetical protein